MLKQAIDVYSTSALCGLSHNVYIYSNLNFQSLEVVPHYRDPQLQVTENKWDL